MTERVSRPRLLIAAAFLLALALAAFLYVSHRLTTASTPSIARIEKLLTDNDLVKPHIQWRGPDRPLHIDLWQHFLVHIPAGMMAGAAGLLAGAGGLKGRRRRLVLIAVCGVLFAAALVAEMNQISLPDREATWSDMLASWAGILAGLGLWLGGEAAWRRFRTAERSGKPPPLDTDSNIHTDSGADSVTGSVKS